MENERRQPTRREPKTRRRGGGAVRRIFFVLGTLVLIGVCTSAMLAGIFLKYVETTLTPTLQVDADDYTMNLSSFIYYQDKETGEWVEFQTVHGVENRIWVDIEDVPDALWQAVVAIEDQRFFQHNGVDWLRTIKATLNMFTNNDTFGGSTITQQMLKNMTKDDKPYVNRKVREIFRALEFEKNYTKAEILELYLNFIYLGGGCGGVQTAAEYYFGKDVSELDAAECASLIAITNNPSAYNPLRDVVFTSDDGTTTTPRKLNKKRQENVLKKMSEVKGPATLEDITSDPDTWDYYLTEEEKDAAQKEILQFTDGTTSADDIVEKATGGIEVNSWFTDQVIRDVTADLVAEYGYTTEEAEARLYNSGYHIYTTLDPDIQAIAERVYLDRGNLNNLTSRDGQPIRSGITVMDPYTGNIVATVGDMGEKDGNLLWSYATDKHQVGSSMKPLTAYAPAIDSGAVTPGSTFDDYPVELLNDNYWPKNSNQKYRGFTSVTYGIQHSINTIAVQTLMAGGVQEAYEFATEKLMLDLEPEDMDRSPLGMGGLHRGLSTVEMAAAYSCFVNSGIYNSPKTYLRVTKVDADGSETVVLENEGESHVAMKETTAYLMTKMLTNAVNAGTGTQAKFNGMTIAGKTGTTSDNYDRYFVGYTPYYVAAVWTGYKSNARISYSGGNPAITLWKKVMQEVHADLPNKSFTRPASGLENVTLCADSGLLATEACQADVRGSRTVTVEIAAGTAPTEKCTLHTMVNYCSDGKCLATESCPESSVKQVAVLDHVREDYGPSVKAEDDAYLLVSMERAIGLAPTIGEDGSESYPEVIGCPVHAGLPVTDPEDPDDPLADPSDENYNPPVPGEEGEGGGTGGGPAAPGEPDEPEDPSGGFGDDGGDWWSGFWNNDQ